jgi:hypothetical protein
MIIHNPILTGSFIVNGTDVASITSSAASITAINSYTASQNNRNGTYATTGSNTFAGIQTVNSNLVVTGSITAQTLVVQTVTSSVVYSSGSNVFGNNIANTQVFTGSMNLTGSLTVVTTGTEFQVNANGVKFGNISTDTHTITGSVNVSGSAIFAGLITGQNSIYQTNAAGNIASNRFGTYNGGATQLFFEYPSAGSVAFNNGSDKLTITSGGAVGIGISPTPWDSTIKSLEIGNRGGFYAGFNSSAVSVIYLGTNAYYNAGWKYANTSAYRPQILDCGDGNFNFQNASSGTEGNAITWTSLMKISSNGDVFIGTEDPNATNTGMALLKYGEIDISRNSGTSGIFNRNTTNGQILDFRYNNTQVGSISTNSNSLPSDLNFKKDITDISIGLNLVTKLRPVHYRHKMDEDNEALSNGIIAQEMEEALSECGIENNSLLMLQHKPNEKENESQYWVDYTKMIPVLVKAIQELQAQITELKNK